VNRKRDNSQTPDWNQNEVNWARILCRPARGGRLHLKEALCTQENRSKHKPNHRRTQHPRVRVLTRANPLGATLGAVEAGVELQAPPKLTEERKPTASETKNLSARPPTEPRRREEEEDGGRRTRKQMGHSSRSARGSSAPG